MASAFINYSVLRISFFDMALYSKAYPVSHIVDTIELLYPGREILGIITKDSDTV